MALTPPFATVDDLEDRWRPLTPTEQALAETKLLDASQLILDEDRRGVLDNLTAPTLTLIGIVCAMVKRAMPGADDDDGAGPGVTQFSQTMGTFTEQRTFANPTADLYLTKAERRRLKLARQRAGYVDMWPGAYGAT